MYGPTSRLLHWVTVFLVSLAWALGMFGESLFGEGEKVLKGADSATLQIHMWAGLAILLITAFRFPWRMTNPPPPPEANEFSQWLVGWTDPAARVTHYVLYLLLFAVPVVGLLLQFSRGHTLSLFGLTQITAPLWLDRGLAHRLEELHEVLANVLVVLALFHAGAAIVHHVVFQDNTLLRMAPCLSKNNTGDHR